MSYRQPLLFALMDRLEDVEVWEHTIDPYVEAGERGLSALSQLASRGVPLAVHSLDLSVGSLACTEQPDRLVAIRRLLAAAGVDTISDHLAFSRVRGRRLGHFAPIWRTEESLELVTSNVDRLQHELGARLALENVALVFDPGGDLGTTEFLTEVAARTGCGIHLDVSNLVIDAANGHVDIDEELACLGGEHVVSMHLAGGSLLGGRWYDTHSRPVDPVALGVLARLLLRTPNCATIVVERDARLAEGAEVCGDLERVHAVVDAIVGRGRRTHAGREISGPAGRAETSAPT